MYNVYLVLRSPSHPVLTINSAASRKASLVSFDRLPMKENGSTSGVQSRRKRHESNCSLCTFNSPSMPSPAFAPPVALPLAQQFPLPMPATQNFWCHGTTTLDVSATCLVLAVVARSPYPLRQQHRWKVMCNCSS